MVVRGGPNCINLQGNFIDIIDIEYLTIVALQNKPDICLNSEDPDETALNEPSHQDIHCLPFCF